MARLVIDVSLELHHVLKSEAALRDLTMRDFVLELVHKEISSRHNAEKEGSHNCPLCEMFDKKSAKKATRRLIEAPLTASNNRHYIFEDELPGALRNI